MLDPKINFIVSKKLRFGFDPIKTVLSQTDNNYNGIEIVGDFSLFKNLFFAIEFGTEDKTKQSEKINFTTTGSYIKLGADYNMYKNWKGMNNQIYIGFRFSNSLHKQRVNSFYLRNSFDPILFLICSSENFHINAST